MGSLWGDKAQERERDHPCNVCDKAFKSLQMPNKHSGHVFSCKGCGKKCNSNNSISRHNKLVCGKPHHRKNFCLFCHLPPVIFFCIHKKKLQQKIGQSGGASRWRVCYQWGLPCLFLFVLQIYIVIAKTFAIIAPAFRSFLPLATSSACMAALLASVCSSRTARYQRQ